MLDKERHDALVTQYSGTTVENFKQCAVSTPDGIFFDKSREPRHAHARFYFDPKFDTAVIFGRDCAIGMIQEHTILIIEGRLASRHHGSLDPGKFFPVEQVWLPRRRIETIDLHVPNGKKIQSLFIPKDPRTMLER